MARLIFLCKRWLGELVKREKGDYLWIGAVAVEGGGSPPPSPFFRDENQWQEALFSRSRISSTRLGDLAEMCFAQNTSLLERPTLRQFRGAHSIGKTHYFQADFTGGGQDDQLW